MVPLVLPAAQSRRRLCCWRCGLRVAERLEDKRIADHPVAVLTTLSISATVGISRHPSARRECQLCATDLTAAIWANT
jgi:hypothetical protein